MGVRISVSLNFPNNTHRLSLLSLAIELVTPPLEDVILPGITRDSVIAIAKDHISGKRKIAGLPDDLIFSERHINMGEVSQAAKEGRLLEVFGSGMSFISSIS